MTENEQLEWALEQSRLQEPIKKEFTKQNQHSQPNLLKKELPNHQKNGENHPHQPQAEIQPKSVLQPQAGMTENEQLAWALEQSKLQEPVQNEITKQDQHSQPNLSKKELPNYRKNGENHPHQPQAVLQPQTVLQPKPVLLPQAGMTEKEQLEWALEQSRLEEPMQIEIKKHSQLNLPKKELPNHQKIGENHPHQPQAVLQPQPVFQPQTEIQPKPVLQPQAGITEKEQLEWALEQSRLEEPMQIEITKHSQLNLPKNVLPNHQKIGENGPIQPQPVYQPQAEIQPKPVLQPHPYMTENEQLKWALEQSKLEEPMQIEITKKQNHLSQPNLHNDEILNHPKVGEYRPIVIDGCNIGHLYGRNQFCAKGRILFRIKTVCRNCELIENLILNGNFYTSTATIKV